MLSANAYAKINLGLELLFKRNDGYHELRSVFHRISLCDIVTVAESTEIVVDCPSLAHEDSRSNLAYKAAKLLQQKAGIVQGAKIRIDKHIPIGAGLGGGSSDAATTLVLLNDLWSCNASTQELAQLAGMLGSDLPFFVHHGAMCASGTGTTLSPCSLELNLAVLLICPPVHVSTPWAYSMLRLGSEPRDGADLCRVLQSAPSHPGILKSELRNDFEPVVFAAHPELKALKQKLYDSGALYAQMSGSGAALFGLFSTHSEAGNAATLFGDVPYKLCSLVH